MMRKMTTRKNIDLLNSLQNLASGQLCLVLPLFRAVRKRDIPDIAPETVLIALRIMGIGMDDGIMDTTMSTVANLAVTRAMAACNGGLICSEENRN